MERNNVQIIAEIGINHNGSIDMAKKLIDVASFSGCDFVKFQKREPDICVPDSQKNIIRDTPWGKIKYIDYKKKIEFGHKEYQIIDKYCKDKGIKWFASAWDIESIEFLKKYVNINKIPSANLTNDPLLEASRKTFGFNLLSTGMSKEHEIELAVDILKPHVLFHTCSAYPSDIKDLNLGYIQHLIKKFNNIDIGYSGHEFGLVTTFASVGIGAKWIERHVTLERTIWGSDQMASVEPHGLIKLVKGVRDIEKAIGSMKNREILSSELKKRQELSLN